MNDKIERLKRAIAAELEYCKHSNTPHICAMKSNPKGYAKVEEMIIDRVVDEGMTIGEAIIDSEKDVDPNQMHD